MVQHIQINNCNTANIQNTGEKNHLIISIDEEKVFEIPFFMIKGMKKIGIEETYLNILWTML
jgi:hypothetical protein